MTTPPQPDKKPRSSVANEPAIGGYFALEPTGTDIGTGARYRDAPSFQSARAAFHALLRSGAPPKVWLPRYICNAMVAPLEACGAIIGYYSLTPDFEVEDSLRPADEDWIVCARYFGIIDGPFRSVAERHGSGRIVADHAQAFFSSPPECLATLYSPRKFFGIPDGGMLVSREHDISAPRHLTWNADPTALLARRERGAEAGYADFLATEKRFDDLTPQAMSPMAKKLLGGIDMDAVAETRRANFSFLHERIGPVNELLLPYTTQDVPLCYPLVCGDRDLDTRLRSHRIYAARYWQDALARSDSGSFEAMLASRLLAIPCDQRYGPDEMQRVVDVVLDLAS